jgi:sec-independent protein translocase protein TatC
MTVAIYTAIGLAIPFLLYQLWAFVAPGLYQHEKKYVIPVLSMGTLLFIIGAAFAYKIAFPAACNFLLGWQEGFQSLLNAEDYLDLILIMMLGLGLVFQIPTISFILGRIGLITPKLLLRWWRHAVVIIVIIAAIITPTPDATTLLIFAVPMWLLYFLSVGIVWMFGKPRKSDEDVGELATNE